MAYIEAFFYFMAVVVFMFVVLFGGFILLYMLVGQIKIFFAKEEVTLGIEKAFLYKLIKNRFFKWAIALYFITSFFFYVNEAFSYFGKDRAYPRAKAYAIAADTVYFWHSVGVNIRLKKGFQEFYRLVQPEDSLDKKIQKVQDFFLSKMYRYIPENDGERDFWYYKYKQLYMVKIRYKPESAALPAPRFLNIMNGLYDTSHKLFDKSCNDKLIDKERYVFIGQMAYYLADNIAYYYSFQSGICYLDRLFLLMDDKKRFQRNIDYADFLYKVYEKFRTDPEVAKAFNNNPYSLGLFYAGILRTYDHLITYNSHNGINPCTSKDLQRFLHLSEDFYYWIFAQKNSSYDTLSSREKGQIKWLYNACALSFSYGVTTYLCEIPFKYKDNRPMATHIHTTILPVFKNEEAFQYQIPTLDEFIKFGKLEKLFKERKLQQEKDRNSGDRILN